MNTEPIELRLPRAAAAPPAPTPTSALDEAFAERTLGHDGLVAAIRTQLDALDAHRQRLAGLLEGLAG